MLLLVSVFTVLITGCSPQYVKLNNSGYKKIKLKDYDGAFQDFDLAVKSNDKYWLSYSNRGASYIQKGNYLNAMKDLDMSIGLDPKHSDAFYNRGLCKRLSGDSIGALNDYKAAYRINDKDLKIQMHLGRLLAEMDSCKEALNYLNNALKGKIFDDCSIEQELKQLQKKCQEKTK